LQRFRRRIVVGKVGGFVGHDGAFLTHHGAHLQDQIPQILGID